MVCWRFRRPTIKPEWVTPDNMRHYWSTHRMLGPCCLCPLIDPMGLNFMECAMYSVAMAPVVSWFQAEIGRQLWLKSVAVFSGNDRLPAKQLELWLQLCNQFDRRFSHPQWTTIQAPWYLNNRCPSNMAHLLYSGSLQTINIDRKRWQTWVRRWKVTSLNWCLLPNFWTSSSPRSWSDLLPMPKYLSRACSVVLSLAHLKQKHTNHLWVDLL